MRCRPDEFPPYEPVPHVDWVKRALALSLAVVALMFASLTVQAADPAASPEASYAPGPTPAVDPDCPWLYPGWTVGDEWGPGETVTCPPDPNPGPISRSMGAPSLDRPQPAVVGLPVATPRPEATLPPTDTAP